MITVDSSYDLDKVLEQNPNQEIVLADNYDGYVLTHPPRGKVNIRAEDIYTRIILDGDWMPGARSLIRNLTIVTRTGSFIADYASHARIERVDFRSALPDQDTHGIKEWDDPRLKVQGTGITVTKGSDGDNSFGIVLDQCRFYQLEYGIYVDGNGYKPTNNWRLTNCVFEDTRYPVIQNWCNRWFIDGGMAQVHRTGLVINGLNNRVNFFHFERGEIDVVVTPQSIDTTILCDSKKEKVRDYGRNSVVLLRGRSK